MSKENCQVPFVAGEHFCIAPDQGGPLPEGIDDPAASVWSGLRLNLLLDKAQRLFNVATVEISRRESPAPFVCHSFGYLFEALLVG